MNSRIITPGNDLSGIDGENLQEKLLALEIKFKSGNISGTELQSRNTIITELKKRTGYIDELSRKHKKLDEEWDRIDGRGREYDQEQIAKERNKIGIVLYLLGYGTEGKLLCTPKLKLEISGRVGQLTLPGFQIKEGGEKRRRK